MLNYGFGLLGAIMLVTVLRSWHQKTCTGLFAGAFSLMAFSMMLRAVVRILGSTSQVYEFAGDGLMLAAGVGFMFVLRDMRRAGQWPMR